MDQNEVNALIEIRNVILNAYSKLEKSSSRNVAIMKQSEAAATYEISINKIDQLLKSYVKFE